jgi:hypothetical protein
VATQALRLSSLQRKLGLACTASPSKSTFKEGDLNRGAQIRTGDLTDPNGARYQAAPRPDKVSSIPHA